MNSTFNGIEFYRITDNNEALAVSPTGTTANGSPSSPDAGSQIKGPDTDTFAGKIYFSSGSPTVSGSGTAFSSQVFAGQSLFAYNGTVPYLLGVVHSVGGNTTLTLTSDIVADTVAAPGVDYGSTNMLLRTGESFLMRVPTIPAGTTAFIVPSIKFLRNPVSVSTSGPNDETLVSLAQYSVIGSPNLVGSSVNIPCTIIRKNILPISYNDFIGYSTLPTYFWYILNPQISSTPALDLLNPNTKFEIFVDSLLPSYQVTNNVTKASEGNVSQLF